jgi:hypothetical protein
MQLCGVFLDCGGGLIDTGLRVSPRQVGPFDGESVDRRSHTSHGPRGMTRFHSWSYSRLYAVYVPTLVIVPSGEVVHSEG